MPPIDNTGLYEKYESEEQPDKGLNIFLPYRPPYRFQIGRASCRERV